MARLASIGFELNTLNTSGGEITTHNGAGGTSSTISTAQVHGGTYSALFNLTSSSGSLDAFQFSTGTGVVFARGYIYVSAYPNHNDTFLSFGNNPLTIATGALFMNSSGQLGIVGTTYGINLTSPISLNTWHYVELKVDTTTINTQIITGRLDGVQIDSQTYSTTLAANSSANLVWGAFLIAGDTNGTISNFYVDDLAVNDSTGSFQNSYPGQGAIVHLHPNAAGDNNAFTVQVGGTAGSANNFTRVQEVTPATGAYNGDTVTNNIDDFNIDNTPSSIASGDLINVVSVGVYYRAAVASLESSFVVRAKKTSGGTVSESPAITPNSTSWFVNANANPSNYPLTLYQDPDSSNWTKATLDTAQIGYRISTGNTNATDISTVWMLVESTPNNITTSTSITTTSSSTSTTSTSSSTSTTSTSSSTSISTSTSTTSTSTSQTTSTSSSTSISTSTTSTSSSTSITSTSTTSTSTSITMSITTSTTTTSTSRTTSTTTSISTSSTTTSTTISSSSSTSLTSTSSSITTTTSTTRSTSTTMTIELMVGTDNIL